MTPKSDGLNSPRIPANPTEVESGTFDDGPAAYPNVQPLGEVETAESVLKKVDGIVTAPVRQHRQTLKHNGKHRQQQQRQFENPSHRSVQLSEVKMHCSL